MLDHLPFLPSEVAFLNVNDNHADDAYSYLWQRNTKTSISAKPLVINFNTAIGLEDARTCIHIVGFSNILNVSTKKYNVNLITWMTLARQFANFLWHTMKNKFSNVPYTKKCLNWQLDWRRYLWFLWQRNTMTSVLAICKLHVITQSRRLILQLQAMWLPPRNVSTGRLAEVTVETIQCKSNKVDDPCHILYDTQWKTMV